MASAVYSKKTTLLLRIRRSKVAKDIVRAQAVVDALRSGATSYRAAVRSVFSSASSMRLKGRVKMDASVGAATVLSPEEENFLEGALVWAAHRYLEVG